MSVTTWPRQLPRFCLSTKGGTRSCAGGVPSVTGGTLGRALPVKEELEGKFIFLLSYCLLRRGEASEVPGRVAAGEAVDVAHGARSGPTLHLPPAWKPEACAGNGWPSSRITSSQDNTWGKWNGEVRVSFKGKGGKCSSFETLRQKWSKNPGVPSTPQWRKLWQRRVAEGRHALLVSGLEESHEEGLGSGWAYFLWICIWNCLRHGIFFPWPHG